MLLLRLAFRNLSRHLRRTLITGAAITFGLAFMILGTNINHGMHNDMIRKGVSQLAGHVVVQAEGYQEERDQDLVVQDASQVAASLAERFPEGQVTRRALLGGLVNSTANSVGVLVTAVDPVPEAGVTDWGEKLSAGEYLSGDSKDILLGSKLAQSLEVELGDKVVFMTQGPEDVESQLFRVKGLVTTGIDDVDGFFALIDIAAANGLMGGDRAHQVAVHLPDDLDTPARVAEAQALVGAPGREVLGWEQAIPEIAELVRLDDKFNNVFLFILGVMVAVGLLNTVLMSVMERIREFGVMLAIGTTRKRLRNLVLLEGMLLGLVSVAAGLVLGLLLSWPANVYGIDYSAFMDVSSMETAGVHIDTLIKAEFHWSLNLIFPLVGLVLTLFACLYPAHKAGLLRPVEAMRHV